MKISIVFAVVFAPSLCAATSVQTGSGRITGVPADYVVTHDWAFTLQKAFLSPSADINPMQEVLPQLEQLDYRDKRVQDVIWPVRERLKGALETMGRSFTEDFYNYRTRSEEDALAKAQKWMLIRHMIDSDLLRSNFTDEDRAYARRAVEYYKGNISLDINHRKISDMLRDIAPALDMAGNSAYGTDAYNTYFDESAALYHRVSDIVGHAALYHVQLQRRRFFDGAKTVLDIGAGEGALAVALASKGYRVSYVDPSQAYADIFQQQVRSQGVAANVDRVFVGKFEDPQFQGGRYDRILAIHSWYAFGLRRDVLEKALSMLAPCGKLLISIVAKDSIPDKLAALVATPEQMEGAHAQGLSAWALREGFPHAYSTITKVFSARTFLNEDGSLTDAARTIASFLLFTNWEKISQPLREAVAQIYRAEAEDGRITFPYGVLTFSPPRGTTTHEIVNQTSSLKAAPVASVNAVDVSPAAERAPEGPARQDYLASLLEPYGAKSLVYTDHGLRVLSIRMPDSADYMSIRSVYTRIKHEIIAKGTLEAPDIIEIRIKKKTYRILWPTSSPEQLSPEQARAVVGRFPQASFAVYRVPRGVMPFANAREVRMVALKPNGDIQKMLRRRGWRMYRVNGEDENDPASYFLYWHDTGKTKSLPTRTDEWRMRLRYALLMTNGFRKARINFLPNNQAPRLVSIQVEYVPGFDNVNKIYSVLSAERAKDAAFAQLDWQISVPLSGQNDLTYRGHIPASEKPLSAQEALAVARRFGLADRFDAYVPEVNGVFTGKAYKIERVSAGAMLSRQEQDVWDGNWVMFDLDPSRQEGKTPRDYYLLWTRVKGG